MNSPIKPTRTARPAAATPDVATHRQRRRSTLLALDANALELFARVVAAGSFAEAARRLGLTRAAVSRRIAAIEAQAGVALLARTTRSLGLTDAGRRLAGYARGVHDAADAARRSVRSGRGALEGRLRITAVPSFGRALLMPLLARFQARHPAVRFELLFTERPIDLLREGIDVAFRLTRKPPPDWLAQPVLSLRIGAYAAPGVCAAPLPDPQALAQLPCLVLGAAAETVPLLWRDDAGTTCTVEVAPSTWGDDMDSLVAMARAGGGVVLAPDYCVRADLQAGRLLDLLPGWRLPVAEGDTLQALTMPIATAPRSARELVKFVREACAVDAAD
ncbi:LysR family transcriptional regulator [Aquabacterium sp.]|uniref:LysR family transcriptional regulator n=1 Tax=Aquabacterium sp. TaxID=1872578 RepID=UPI002CD2DD23|nr:LysR family transcriptional regulator [Aquabacterium sp.]HSW08392.1 LysR family transcriptional regulator [Aquabacterium sp.]